MIETVVSRVPVSRRQKYCIPTPKNYQPEGGRAKHERYFTWDLNNRAFWFVPFYYDDKKERLLNLLLNLLFTLQVIGVYAPINVKPLGGRPGKGGGFDCNHGPVVGFFDRFNVLSSNILLTFGCYFDNPQCPGVGHLNGNSQLSSNAPPMPGLPPPPPPAA